MKQVRDYVWVYRDRAGEWRWRYKTANGRTMADSGQGYSKRSDAVHGARKVTHGTVPVFEAQQTKRGAVKWVEI